MNDGIHLKRKFSALKMEARRERWGYIFVLPFVLVYAACHLYPIIYTFILSFTDLYRLKQNTDLTFVGFANYARLLHDKYFWGSAANTMIIWLCGFVPQVLIALVMAIWLSDHRIRLKGKGLFRTLFFMPNLLTAASVALLFQRFFSYPLGPVNQFLQNSLGLYDSAVVNGVEVQQAFDFFRSPVAARGIVSFIQWWMWVGYTTILLMAGITGIPLSLYEAAIVDGAREWQQTWYITLPMLRPIMIYIMVTSLIGGMQMFDIPFCLSGMGAAPDLVRTSSVYFYSVAFGGGNNYAYGAAVSVGMFFITMIMALLLYMLIREKPEAKSTGGC